MLNTVRNNNVAFPVSVNVSVRFMAPVGILGHLSDGQIVCDEVYSSSGALDVNLGFLNCCKQKSNYTCHMYTFICIRPAGPRAQ